MKFPRRGSPTGNVRSLHVRVVLVASLFTGFAPDVLCAAAPDTYLFRLTFTAVLPFPNRSYAAPIRGVMSFHAIAGVSGNDRSRVGTSGPGPTCCAGKYRLK